MPVPSAAIDGGVLLTQDQAGALYNYSFVARGGASGVHEPRPVSVKLWSDRISRSPASETFPERVRFCKDAWPTMARARNDAPRLIACVGLAASARSSWGARPNEWLGRASRLRRRRRAHSRRALCRLPRGASPAAGVRGATSFLGAIACIEPSEDSGTLPVEPAGPDLSILGTPSAPGLFSTLPDQATLEAWVAGGAPAFASDVHTPDIVRSALARFHGTLLRSDHWAQMLDANDPTRAVPATTERRRAAAGIEFAAPGAPSCYELSRRAGRGTRVQAPATVQALGVIRLATSASFRRMPPPPEHTRPTFSPARRGRPGSAARHATPTPGKEVISGLHGDGIVEITFDKKTIGPEASFETRGRASVRHLPRLRRTAPEATGSDTTRDGLQRLHRSPPPSRLGDHAPAATPKANADGTGLTGGPLHLDGRVELGDGSGKCGACHGKGDSPGRALRRIRLTKTRPLPNRSSARAAISFPPRSFHRGTWTAS